MQGYIVELAPDEVLCREGDPENDLYLVDKGLLLICVRKGSQVTAVAEIGPGEFVGELALFDGHPRSADIIAKEHTVLVKIAAQEVRQFFPTWLMRMGKSLSHKIRQHDEAIRQKGLKKRQAQTVRALSPDEQRILLDILNK